MIKLINLYIYSGVLIMFTNALFIKLLFCGPRSSARNWISLPVAFAVYRSARFMYLTVITNKLYGSPTLLQINYSDSQLSIAYIKEMYTVHS